MVWTSPRAYNFNCSRLLSSQYLFYVPNKDSSNQQHSDYTALERSRRDTEHKSYIIHIIVALFSELA